MILLKKLLRTWSGPLLSGLLLFALTQPVLAQFSSIESNSSSIKAIGIESVEGYQHIYVQDEKDTSRFLTEGSRNDSQFDTDNNDIVWVTTDAQGNGQIFLHSLSANTTIQLTRSGQHQYPKVSNGKVVWEQWVDDTWQVFFYDGIKIQQLSTGKTTVSPQIENDTIIFSQKNDQGSWSVFSYNFLTEQVKQVAQGSLAKRAQLQDGRVVLLEELKVASPSTKITVTPIAKARTVTPAETPNPITTSTDEEIQEEVQEELSGEIRPILVETAIPESPEPSNAPEESASPLPTSMPEETSSATEESSLQLEQ